MDKFSHFSILMLVFLLCYYVRKSTGSTSNFSWCSDVTSHKPTCESEDYNDGNTLGVPVGRNRVCKLEYDKTKNCYRMRWYTGRLQDYFRNYATLCPAIVGMNLVVQCMNGNGTVYRNGQSKGSTYANLTNITLEDAGSYECRQEDTVVAAFNISVSEDAHIGYAVDGGQFVNQYYPDGSGDQHQCCRSRKTWTIGTNSKSQITKQFYVYGTDPILRAERVVYEGDHYQTNLNISVTRSPHDPLLWDLTIGHVPVYESPHVKIVLRATNNHSSHTLCIDTHFETGNSPLFISQNVPRNKTAIVGENVTFECVIGSNEKEEVRDFLTKVKLEFHPPENFSTNTSTFIATCHLNDDDCTYPDDYPVVVNKRIIASSQSFQNVSFRLQVPFVSEEYNSSVFACAVLYDGYIEWRKEVDLTLQLPLLPPETDHSEADRDTVAHNPAKYIAPICVALVITLITVLVALIFIVLAIKRRKGRLPPDEVPLTGQQPDFYSSQSTICSETLGTPGAQQNGVPCLEISSVNEIQPDIIVREPRPRRKHNSVDSGVDETNSIDNFSLDSGVPSRKPRSSLHLQLFPRFHPYTELSPIRLCRSESDLTPSSVIPTKEQGSSMSELYGSKKCVVYISYTDKMADWVKSYLKPQIESWKTTEVMLHESDMIPGLTISSERQRLILEADKIVIVVSSDYSQSQWCSYELVHAIHKEPALCRGKIIPILVDGCQRLPDVIKGLVPLPAYDLDFNNRLWYAIHQSPQMV